MWNRLFEPIRIGKMELRNRIVMPPMVTQFANIDGTVSERTQNYYATRAKGGAGLIIVEATAVVQGGRNSPRLLSLDRDEVIPSFKSLVDAVQQEGAKIAIQLVHCGKQGRETTIGQQPVAPSPIPFKGFEVPRELTIGEIENLVNVFAGAARRARDAGFDAVEIHCAHGYLLSEFLSPFSNKREDPYGGNAENRARFPMEVIKEMRAKLGKDYPILVRMNGVDFLPYHYLPGGLTLEESSIHARLFEQAGVDCIDVSAGNYEVQSGIIQPAPWPKGCLVYLANAIKKVVHVPVITAGRINNPKLADNILTEGKADLIAIGRGLIADPELPNKAKEGRLDDIRICIACMVCVESTIFRSGIGCSINPAYGNEKEYAILPTEKPQKVLVAGGGVAGLEAARVAALRGHKVVLYEEGNKLGGQVLLAAVPPYKEELSNLTRFLVNQVAKLGVEINLNCKVTPDLVLKMKPDIVVVATGAKAIIPEIPGIDRSNVFMSHDVLIQKKDELGEKVIIIGGGRVGCETAELLADRGKKITILKVRDQIGDDMPFFDREEILPRLEKKKVRIEFNTTVEEISSTGVLANVGNRPVEFDADSVVIAKGSIANTELVKLLEGKFAHLKVIGDCKEPRRIRDAILEGYRAALEI